MTIAADSALKATIDVRTLVPHERHGLVFCTFDHLEDGEGFLLINNHDPQPLLFRFEATRPGKFNWEYLEKGPDVWLVRINRTAG